MAQAIRVGLDLNQFRMQNASSSTGKGDEPGARLRHADFSEALAALHEAAQDPDDNPARSEMITPQALHRVTETFGVVIANPVALDDQIAELNADSVTYRALATGLTRRFALMQLAIDGK